MEWTQDELLKQMEERAGKPTAELTKRILDWSNERGWGYRAGGGADYGSGTIYVKRGKSEYEFGYLYVEREGDGRKGAFNMRFNSLRDRLPFPNDQSLESLRGLINKIHGAELPAEAIHQDYSAFDIRLLGTDEGWQAFVNAADWFVQTIDDAGSVG
ncbi:MAG: hypothetical protein ABI743_00705 [bacterium]